MLAMKRYPRSFLQLITLGHFLFAMPLLIAAGYVFFKLQALNDHYRAAIEHASISSRLSGELAEDLLHMERNLRRYVLLKNADTLHDYNDVRSEWQEHVDAFARLPQLPLTIVNELQDLMASEKRAYVAMLDSGNTATLQAAIDELKQRSSTTLESARKVLDDDQARFLRESEALSQQLILAAVIAVAVALCCLWAVRSLLARLIARFERALLRLGKGDLQQPIELDGPGDLRWLGRWLEWLRRRLLSLEEGRTQVLRHVSHELKTPLAAMQEGSSLLAEEVPGPLTPEQRRIVNILQSNSRRLQDLIDGLLRLQQAGHIAERISYETLRFDHLIEQVLETCRLIAGERNISFHCELGETEIVAGREALITIVHNLLSNAIKFSPEYGSIRVALQHDKEQAVLDVMDDGPGVSGHDAGHIFEPFYRSEASRQIAGIGLGLAIARKFVEAHRGDISLMPTGKGGHFRVTMPLNAPYFGAQVDV